MPRNNQSRIAIYQKRKKQGLCPRCGAKRKNLGYINCDDCRSYYRSYPAPANIQKNRYRNRIKNNLCPRCGKKHGKKYTHKLCANCITKLATYK